MFKDSDLIDCDCGSHVQSGSRITGSYKSGVQETVVKPGISWLCLCIAKTQVSFVPSLSLFLASMSCPWLPGKSDFSFFTSIPIQFNFSTTAAIYLYRQGLPTESSARVQAIKG